MQDDAFLETALRELRAGVLERDVAGRVGVLRAAVEGREDAGEWQARIKDAVRVGAGVRRRGGDDGVAAFRKQLKETRREGATQAKGIGELEAITRVTRTLYDASTKHDTSLTLVDEASEALHSVLKEYSHVNATLSITGRFLNQISDKAKRDAFCLRAAVAYFFVVSFLIVVSRMFGIF